MTCLVNMYWPSVTKKGRKCFGQLRKKRTYLPTPWSRFLLEKLTGSELVKKSPAFYGNQKFNTVLTRVLPLVPIQNQINQAHAPPCHFLKIHLIIFFRPRLGLPSGLFSSSFPTKNLYAPLLSPICNMFPPHLILLNLIAQIIFCDSTDQ